MDIERMKKLLSSEIEAGNKVKAVREVIKTYDTRKHDMYDNTSEILKPSIDVQKSIDEKQDKVIKQLKENNEELVEAINFDPTKAISWEGKKLPALDWHDYEDEVEDEVEDEGESEDEEVKPSTSEKKPQVVNLDKGITDEYKTLLEDKGLPLPSEVMKEGLDTNELIKKVNEK